MISFISRLLKPTILLALFASCQQPKSPEQKIRIFLGEFQASLSKPDGEVLKYFRTHQTQGAILAVVNALRNTDSVKIKCTPDFKMATIQVSEGVSVVSLPVYMALPDEKNEPEVRDIHLFLTPLNDSYVITDLSGKEFYGHYTYLENRITHEQEWKEKTKEYLPIYTRARELEAHYDSAIWFAKTDSGLYFYVLNGKWNLDYFGNPENAIKPEYKLGLVAYDGTEIIPPRYDLIGNFNSQMPGYIEVKGQEGYGIFSLQGQVIIPPKFKRIIPYSDQRGWVVQDTTGYYWIDLTGFKSNGFPDSVVRDYVKLFRYLPKGKIIDREQVKFCEFTSDVRPGSGVHITPSYLVHTGFYREVETDFSTIPLDQRMGGWKDYVEVTGTFFQALNDKFSIAITEFKERFLEGRAEFYQRRNIVVSDSALNIIGHYKAYSNGNVYVKQINDTLIEVSENQGMTDADGLVAGWGGIPPELQVDGRTYDYFSLIDGKMTPVLNANRFYNFTKYIKLDSTYITGNFKVCLNNDDIWTPAQAMPLRTLIYMRSEILAEYGFTFPEGQVPIEIAYRGNYKPRYQTEEELEPFLSDIDKYNLAFLANAIQRYKHEEPNP